MQQAIRSFFKKHLALNVIALAVVFILIEGLYSFCSKPKTVNCPAFADANFDAWFPYQVNQKIYFKSSQNKLDTITVGTVTKSTAYKGVGSTASCGMNAQITSSETKNALTKLSVFYDIYQSSHNLSIILYNFQVSGILTETDLSIINGSQKSEFLANTTINGRSFSNVLQIQSDTALVKEEGVYKIWLSKQTGLVGYERYPSFEQFVKQ